MKKTILGLVLFAVLGLALSPAVALGQGKTIPKGCGQLTDNLGYDCLLAGPSGDGDCSDVSLDPTGKCSICCILQTIKKITDWIFYLLTLFVVIMIIFGGFSIITASGDPEKAAKGRGILTYAIIGLAVALLAKLVPSLVGFIMGM